MWVKDTYEPLNAPIGFLGEVTASASWGRVVWKLRRARKGVLVVGLERCRRAKGRRREAMVEVIVVRGCAVGDIMWLVREDMSCEVVVGCCSRLLLAEEGPSSRSATTME